MHKLISSREDIAVDEVDVNTRDQRVDELSAQKTIWREENPHDVVPKIMIKTWREAKAKLNRDARKGSEALSSVFIGHPSGQTSNQNSASQRPLRLRHHQRLQTIHNPLRKIIQILSLQPKRKRRPQARNIPN